MAHVGDHSRAIKGLERQIMDLLAAFDEVLRRIDMAAGVEPHVDAAHDLAGAAGGIGSLSTLRSFWPRQMMRSRVTR